MIYNQQHNKLFPTPVVEKPDRDDKKYYSRKLMQPFGYIGTMDMGRFKDDEQAYNTWLSSGIEVIGDHNWKDGQEVEEGRDFTIEWYNHGGFDKPDNYGNAVFPIK